MNILINSCNYGSTGNIMIGIHNKLFENDFPSHISCADSRINRLKKIDNQIYIGNIIERKLHIILSTLFGYNGCFSHLGTYFFLKKLDKIHPDIIHLHNLHNSYINLPLLFRYIKKNNIKIVWTLHDCWAFTGHCPHFTIENCNKWKTGCYSCPRYREYPQSLFDNSKKMYRLKKKWFTGIKDLTIVTPSQWLGDLVKQSFLKEYPVKVINNGINLDIFKPTESNFREKYNIPKDKFIVLGVAFGWGYRKGLDVFVELSKTLGDEFQIVLVGTNDKVDEQLPDNIISIHRTENQTELAEIYTAANVFVNPTREENFPTVNMEALACGTSVITFNTGGSTEMLDKTCGGGVAYNNNNALKDEIIRVCKEQPYSKEACLKRASEFDKNDKFKEYIDLYKQV